MNTEDEGADAWARQSEDPAERRLFVLDAHAWALFEEALTRPPREIPGLRQLMARPTLLAPGGDHQLTSSTTAAAEVIGVPRRTRPRTAATRGFLASVPMAEPGLRDEFSRELTETTDDIADLALGVGEVSGGASVGIMATR
jgi:hypothetical protein